jgi:hypothetical protein
MSKLILIFGSLLLLANTIIGVILSNYLAFNWLSVDIVLLINTVLLYKLVTGNISNGYKISLSFIYPLLCFISVVLAVLSPNKFKDNYYLVGFILILFIEISFYSITTNIKSINSK